jgi:outer membrane protein assembly factor BamD
MMKPTIRSLAALVLFLMALSCSKQVHELDPVDDAMARAMKKFERERYVDALDRFTKMSLDYAGSRLMDSIRYMEAECQYRLDEHLLAADLYQELIERYPNSSLVDDSRLRIADCYFELSPKAALDQSFTYRAIEEYQSLLDDYPESEHQPLAEERIDSCRAKLARKDLRNAELYYRMSKYKSSLLYLDDILETWYDQPEVMEKAMYYKSLCQVRMKREADARATMREYLRIFPDGAHEAQMGQMLDEME